MKFLACLILCLTLCLSGAPLRAQTTNISSTIRAYIDAAPSGFESLKEKDAAADRTGIWHSTLVLDGATSCYVGRDRPTFLGCFFADFANLDAIKSKYSELVSSVQAALPSGWSSTEQPPRQDEVAFHEFTRPDGYYILIWIAPDNRYPLNLKVFSRPAFDEMIKGFVESAENGFEDLKGTEFPTGDGSQSWYSKYELPNSDACVIQDDNPIYLTCKFGDIAIEKAVTSQYDSMVASITKALPAGWNSKDMPPAADEIAYHRFEGPDQMQMDVWISAPANRRDYSVTFQMMSPPDFSDPIEAYIETFSQGFEPLKGPAIPAPDGAQAWRSAYGLPNALECGVWEPKPDHLKCDFESNADQKMIEAQFSKLVSSIEGVLPAGWSSTDATPQNGEIAAHNMTNTSLGMVMRVSILRDPMNREYYVHFDAYGTPGRRVV